MSNTRKLIHTAVCLIVLSVISIPFYSAVQATTDKPETRKAVVKGPSVEQFAALAR